MCVVLYICVKEWHVRVCAYDLRVCVYVYVYVSVYVCECVHTYI